MTLMEIARSAATQLAFVALIGLLVLPLCALLRRKAARWQSALCWLVLLRAVLPTELGHPWSMRAVISRTSNAAELPAITSVFSDAVSLGTIATPSPAPPAPWLLLAALLWTLGVAAVALRRTGERRSTMRMLRRGVPLADPRRLALVLELTHALRVQRRVRVLVVDAPIVPFTCGFLRPLIAIPKRMLAPDAEGALEAALAHELAHVARWDALSLGAERVIGTLYWFHPAVRLATGRLARVRETLTDDAVIASGALGRKRYARGLLDAASLSLTPMNSSPLSLPRTELSMRLRDLLSPSSRSFKTPTLLVTLALAALLLPLAPARAGAPSEPGPRTEGPAESESTELLWPVPGGEVSAAFGMGRDPISGRERHHDGLDIRAAAGTPILAPAAGTVRVATTHYERGASWGHVVILEHDDGLETRWAHLGRLLVGSGQRIAAGEPFAEVGSTGRSTGPHVHLELRVTGELVDPASFLRAPTR